MKSENWMRMQAVSAAGVCLAMLFITYGAQAQGKTSQDLNANETIWSFLVSKKLAAKSGTDNSPSAK
jgi:hypothetical protein